MERLTGKHIIDCDEAGWGNGVVDRYCYLLSLIEDPPPEAIADWTDEQFAAGIEKVHPLMGPVGVWKDADKVYELGEPIGDDGGTPIHEIKFRPLRVRDLLYDRADDEAGGRDAPSIERIIKVTGLSGGMLRALTATDFLEVQRLAYPFACPKTLLAIFSSDSRASAGSPVAKR